MSDGMNKWIGIGNLCADGELRVTPSGQSVLKLRLACSESYLDRNNTRQERTEFLNCTVWGKRAEGLAKILSKGDRLAVEGSIRTNVVEKDGQKKYFTEINVTNVVLCGGGRRDGAPQQDHTARAPQAQQAPADDFGFGSNSDDSDIPF